MTARRSLLALVAIVVLAAGIEYAMGRPPICTCGRVALWGPVGPTQSQMLADWYSPSHVIHGFAFYAIGWALLRRTGTGTRLVLATLAEAGWELLENTPLVIDRYREATMALGYTGDSILNSVSDIAMMLLGFALARRLPLWASIAVVVALELVALAAIRDNLSLNVLMLVYPVPAILDWQAG